MDFSDYEGATHTHDMNQPLPDALRGRYSLVQDGGTLEHVFNVPQGMRNCMEMVRVGGHFTQETVANNCMGHGFWQFSPELVYRAFNEANGYKVEAVLLREMVPGGAWYAVRDPGPDAPVNGSPLKAALRRSLPPRVLGVLRRARRMVSLTFDPVCYRRVREDELLAGKVT